jgi:membrane associated rhomboid family serine protease
MDKPKHMKDVPVSVFLAVSIVLIFSLYATVVLKEIPCGKDVMSLFYSNFVHVDIYHLLSNIFALYALSRVEIAIGGKKFMTLIVFLLIFNTIAESIMYKLFKNLPCSIGISGVLFGVTAWEMITNKGFDWLVAVSLVVMIAGPSIQDPKASLMGHSIGAIAGIIGGLLWSKIS